MYSSVCIYKNPSKNFILDTVINRRCAGVFTTYRVRYSQFDEGSRLSEDYNVNQRNYTFKILIFKILNYIYHETCRGHGDDGPPVSVEHGLEGGLLVLLLEHVDQRGEHDRSHAWERGIATKFARNKFHEICIIIFRILSSRNLPN